MLSHALWIVAPEKKGEKFHWSRINSEYLNLVTIQSILISHHRVKGKLLFMYFFLSTYQSASRKWHGVWWHTCNTYCDKNNIYVAVYANIFNIVVVCYKEEYNSIFYTECACKRGEENNNLKEMLHLYFKYQSLNKCCKFQYPTSVMSYHDKHVSMLQFHCQHLLIWYMFCTSGLFYVL